MIPSASLFDNSIDGDSITLIYNNEVLLLIRCSSKPLSLKIDPVKDNE
jgi:hypothetical protein